ncbi:MAG: hypothetical protein H7122_08670 [Chitinophagaceae bacterium]|nr:hypothetical protein [Chitinophagaceae bacterium]
MKPLNRRIILPVLLLCTLASTATPKTAIPFFNSFTLINSIKNAPVEKNNAKICACQMMDVKSNNEDLKNLVVFAEKTNNGDLSNEYQAAMQVLHKEKKNLKTFYSTITVKREILVTTDCASLYKQLKGTYENLKVLETLDADIRLAIK